MRSRKAILEDLVLLQGRIEELAEEISQYPWDVAAPLLKVHEKNVITVLQRCIDSKIDMDTVSKWANALECRDDLDFTNEVQEIIYELANPEINGELTKKRLGEIIKMLEK